MERWAGKLAVVTGASSGIGAATVKALAKEGVNVVAIGRRIENLQTLAEELDGEPGQVHPVKADVRNEEELVGAFDWIENELHQPVHILINNAGVSILRDTIDGIMEEWRAIFETNVLGAGICIREHLKSMDKHGEDGGHIINICSIVAHKILPSFPGFYVYSASKHALRVITEGVRQELLRKRSTTKITSVSPGYTKTELFDTAADYSQTSANALAVIAHLTSEDITNAIMYSLALPQNVRVHELTVQATGESF